MERMQGLMAKANEEQRAKYELQLAELNTRLLEAESKGPARDVDGGVASLLLSAQESPPSRADVLEEVVVTAQKRSEDVQKVPMAISVLSEADVLAAGAVSAVDLNTLVPGLQVVLSGPFAMASIRGI